MFKSAGEVPTGDGTAYVTRSTAFSNRKGLNNCENGQIVWFQERSRTICDNENVEVSKVKSSLKLRGKKTFCSSSEDYKRFINEAI